ncbi:MAG TPA: MBL fold metallo-hydrolase [Xanthobacteraceae bacterium]|jgi:glyoxylase-like metal-dependent hydrolase (beta-lactamase superfamily II)
MSTAIKLHDITVHPVVEQQGPFFDVLEFFPTLTKERLAENRSWLEPTFIDPATGRLVLCIQSFVIRTPQHNILIDSCVGNDKPRPARPFWNMMQGGRFEQGLTAAGLGIDDIDYVMCTHLHVDHVGWNTRLANGRWVPTFPKSQYVMADRELAYWTQKEKEAPSDVPWITDSVLPIVEARRAQIVKSDFALNEAVQFIPTPGHTIDHYSVLVGRPGADALITGDMIHSPIQGRYPDLGMRADYDSPQAGKTRRQVFERFCEAPTLMCVTHFPSPSTGRVRRWGDGYKFVA